ncbi:MAG: HDIG domain-containing protein [Clostridiales bacterium]|nr:HDIG domain-containing protein [Clostridiales bacterium]
MAPKMPVNTLAKLSIGKFFDNLCKALQTKTAKCFYILLAASVLLIVLFFVAITPERYHLQVGDIAYKTITASKDVVDETATARQREEAARLVEPIYLHKEGVAAEVLQTLTSVLTQVNAVQQYGKSTLEQYAPGDAKAQRAYVFNTAELEYAASLAPSLSLASYQLDTLLRASDDDIQNMNLNITAAVENTMSSTVREGYVNEAIDYLQQIIGYKTGIDLLQNVVTPILRKVIQPNMIIDTEATEALRQEARDAVEPVVYKQGQNIIVARERVTANQLEMLRSLGLLDDENIDMISYLGGGLIVLLAMAVLTIILWLFGRGNFVDPMKLTILLIVLCISFTACIGGKLIHIAAPPILLGAMAVTSLLGMAYGFAANISLAILVSSLILGGDSTFGTEMVNLILPALISGFVVIMMIRRRPNRQQILIAGVVAAVINMLIILSVSFMTNTSIADGFTNALWSAAGAVVASLLCVGLDLVFETTFRLATPGKLLELSNPNHPLLRRLLLEAPGTYHHSIIVANLAESAAEAIGANPLLARVGAYFHDIGKMKRPIYFKENQFGEDPHQMTNPFVSAAILIAHTTDGLALAQSYRLPLEIQDIIVEHHGDTPVIYFYQKAMEESDDQLVDIDDFRYDGRRPHTKESAIIMLADTVEAAVRSMPDPTPKTIRANIEKLVSNKIQDGQLSQAPITLSDIDKISEAFATVLNGVFHERIEYPEPPAKREKPKTAYNPASASAPAPAVKKPKPAAEKKSDAALNPEEPNKP